MLGAEQRAILLAVAAKSIDHGLAHGRALVVDAQDYPEELREPGASFVTVTRGGELRGCIGSLAATRALVEDVAHNAYAAAFRDPRFAPLSPPERPSLEIHISVLSSAEPIEFTDEAQLLGQLRPGIDGLILQEGARRGTFLPSVWRSLPDPRDFLHHLKVKAGLRPDHWSNDIRVQRYTVEEFGNE